MIKDTKIAINTLFHNLWTDTDIHFNGLDFDIAGKEEWIYVSYEPVLSIPAGVSNMGYFDNGVIKVTIYARKENRTFELLDSLLYMLQNNKIADMVGYNNKVGSKGVMSTTNGDYMYLNNSYYIKNY